MYLFKWLWHQARERDGAVLCEAHQLRTTALLAGADPLTLYRCARTLAAAGDQFRRGLDPRRPAAPLSADRPGPSRVGTGARPAPPRARTAWRPHSSAP